MSATSPLGWPYMTGGDGASTIAASIKDTVDAIDTTVGAVVASTGWVNITALSSGWSADSATPQAILEGKWVSFQGGIVDTVFATSSYLDVFTLPASIPPPTGTRVYELPGITYRMLRVLATGHVQIQAPTASTIAYSLDVVRYRIA